MQLQAFASRHKQSPEMWRSSYSYHTVFTVHPVASYKYVVRDKMHSLEQTYDIH